MMKNVLYLAGGVLLFVFGIGVVMTAAKYDPTADIITGAALSLTGFFISLVQSITIGILNSKK